MTKELIASLEEDLRKAMLASDVATLDKLLSDDLIFTTHTGQRITKQDDLASHREGIFGFNDITFDDQLISEAENFAIVSVKVVINGVYNGQPANGVFMFTRVWSLGPMGWQVSAGHACLVD